MILQTLIVCPTQIPRTLPPPILTFIPPNIRLELLKFIMIPIGCYTIPSFRTIARTWIVIEISTERVGWRLRIGPFGNGGLHRRQWCGRIGPKEFRQSLVGIGLVGKLHNETWTIVACTIGGAPHDTILMIGRDAYQEHI